MATNTPNASSLAEVLDRILDKGMVIDVWARISVVGIEILTVEARVVVASVDTFIHYAQQISMIEQASQTGELEDMQNLETGVGPIEPRAIEVEES
ncbi:gas vesicle protein GvpA [Halomarina rubra]|uniref:Gas vesicle protein A n=1 Tax=Halomarina rubra TaxID=2071873 RepID=A0ABD6AZJ2_9EURY|nr:gas vesicle structural protein GvpA [Halomarina rubra]